MGSLLYLAVFVGILYWTFVKVRKRASQSRRQRRFTLATSLLQLAGGLVIAFALPTLVRDTPGSPAALVMLTVCWLIGGVMVVRAIVSILGAWLAKPTDATRV